VLMWLMKTLLTSRCINQRGAGHGVNATYPVVVVSSKLADYTIGEPSTFTFAKVDREKWYGSMRKPASAGFLLWKNLNLNISMVLAKSAAEGLNISRNRYTVYLYSICVGC
ncbi:hypothetical protein, partial [Klebsiella quasipneumoniae]